MSAPEYGPFGGGWNLPSGWPDPLPTPPKVKPGRRHYLALVRLEPIGDLVAFADAIAAAMKQPIKSTPDPDNRSLCVTYEIVHKTPMHALSGVEFRLRRAVKRSGYELRRLSMDVVDAETARAGTSGTTR